MDPENAETFFKASLQSSAMYLLEIGSGSQDELRLQSCRCGDLIHFRVRDEQGEVLFQVCGKDVDEVAAQLVLASLQKISTEQLRALHKHPLRKILELRK